MAEVDEVAQLADAILQATGYPAGTVRPVSETGADIQLQLQGSSTTWVLAVTNHACIGKLPEVSLVSPLKQLAHVSFDGVVCVSDGQGLSIDYARMPEVKAHAACAALDILEKAEVDATNGSFEFFDEVEGYWEGMPKALLARSAVEVDATSRKIYGHIQSNGHDSNCKYFSEYRGTAPSEFDTSKLTSIVGLYISIEQRVAPPAPGEELTEDYLDRLIASFGPAEKALWAEFISHRQSGRRLACLLVSQPRSSGVRSLVGLTFQVRGGQVIGKLKPLKIKRHSTEFMRVRGGASGQHGKTHVAVIGCGSVGSEIADALASIGIGKLTLVDPDFFDVENVFRHALGKSAIGKSKVDALEAELKSKYPGLEIAKHKGSASGWLKPGNIKDVSAVVIAVGQPTIERDYAKDLKKELPGIPVVVTWMEPLGLGGHVVALSPNGEGCLDCVYRDDENQPCLHPSVSFIEPHQIVSRNLTGCIGTHVPYSALHSRRTALLATEVVMAQLEGDLAPVYTYWVGKDRMATEAGIKTSSW